MTEQQLNKKQAAMSDAELAEKCEKLIFDFDENGEKNWTRSIPPNVNDYDMLLCELVRRFNEKIEFMKKVDNLCGEAAELIEKLQQKQPLL